MHGNGTVTVVEQQEIFPWYPPAPPSTMLAKLQKGIIPERFRGTKTVYLLHFDTPIGTENHQALHYVGITENLPARIQQHRRGNRRQCVLTAELKQRKGSFCVGMIWEGVNEEFERYIKSWGSHKAFCTCCQDVPFF